MLNGILRPKERKNIANLLDLPPSYGETGLLMLERTVNEELLGAFTRITAPLIFFCI